MIFSYAMFIFQSDENYNITDWLLPVNQNEDSIISQTSLLRGQLVKCLQLYNQIHWYLLLKENERSCCTAKASHIFQQKYWHIWDI